MLADTEQPATVSSRAIVSDDGLAIWLTVCAVHGDGAAAS